MTAKIFLILVSVLYFGLAIWCCVRPDLTSAKVGFDLVNDSGRSEFMTVYGGLEFGIAVIFLLTALRPEAIGWGLLACTIIHGSLVLFRSISFLIYSDIEGFTHRLAIGEWVIFIAGILLILFHQKKG